MYLVKAALSTNLKLNTNNIECIYIIFSTIRSVFVLGIVELHYGKYVFVGILHSPSLLARGGSSTTVPLVDILASQGWQ